MWRFSRKPCDTKPPVLMLFWGGDAELDVAAYMKLFHVTKWSIRVSIIILPGFARLSSDRHFEHQHIPSPSFSQSLTHTHYPLKYHNILDIHPPRWVMGRRDCSEGSNPCQNKYSPSKIDSTKIRKFSAPSMQMSFFSMKVRIHVSHSLCNLSLNCCWSLIEHLFYEIS